MNFDPVFLALESSALSIWIRESPSLLALPGILTLHTLAMGLLAGTSLVIALRLRRIVLTSNHFGAEVARKTRLLAITSVALWAAAITVGRLLPYTYDRLLVFE